MPEGIKHMKRTIICIHHQRVRTLIMRPRIGISRKELNGGRFWGRRATGVSDSEKESESMRQGEREKEGARERERDWERERGREKRVRKSFPALPTNDVDERNHEWESCAAILNELTEKKKKRHREYLRTRKILLAKEAKIMIRNVELSWNEDLSIDSTAGVFWEWEEGNERRRRWTKEKGGGREGKEGRRTRDIYDEKEKRRKMNDSKKWSHTSPQILHVRIETITDKKVRTSLFVGGGT